MAKLIMLSGLPASGKSTKAKEIVEQGNWVRLNKDLIRKMLHFDKFTGRNEGITKKTERELAIYFLGTGINVVIDDTNLGDGYIQSWLQVAKDCEAKFERILIDTPIEECITRDYWRDEKVGKDVIVNMARRFKFDGAFSKREIIVDLDGTLCDIEHRLHHVKGEKKDWKSFFEALSEDKVRDDVLSQVYAFDDAEIILVSGRPDNYKKETIEWLKKHQIGYKTLIMRRSGDHRPDTETKQEILDNYFEKDRVVAVFDDRPSVIKMWRKNGLNVIDVGQGIEF